MISSSLRVSLDGQESAQLVSVNITDHLVKTHSREQIEIMVVDDVATMWWGFDAFGQG